MAVAGRIVEVFGRGVLWYDMAKSFRRVAVEDQPLLCTYNMEVMFVTASQLSGPQYVFQSPAEGAVMYRYLRTRRYVLSKSNPCNNSALLKYF